MKKEGLGQCPASIENININSVDGGFGIKVSRPRLLLHSCCGPCSTACIERLMDEYEITVFSYNPNITDREEYELRLDSQRKVVDWFNERGTFMVSRIGLIEGEYRPHDFYRCAEGLEDEPEGGTRCAECFRLRLSETAARAASSGYDFFATTLTVSPHKNYSVISEIGRKLAEEYGISYLDMDFKKKAGFQRSIELSKEMGLYRQNYCGCEFSKWFNR